MNIAIRDFEHSAFKIEKENYSLKYQIEEKDKEISNLKSEIFSKDKRIGNLQAEIAKIKNELQKFKNFWHRLMKHFQNKIGFDKDEKYKYVSDDLYKNGIFEDNDNRIVNDVSRKVRPADEIDITKTKKKNNMDLK